ncbi:uncharacterized protein LOC124115677 isoform X2 [Haliotis rufescens]|uniref:uncharacterized protein LOC124115677 isoform X2 n=1 Tax=Haliotis rufescens TaxID=6454 RepID=UPI00201FA704|nr:uncharacterized protein LOC124115677 isoform X2 [Haliotis rufescens]
MPTSSQALILIKTDSGRLSTFYKTRVTPDMTPLPLSRVNLTGDPAARVPYTRPKEMVHSQSEPFQPSKPLEGQTVSGYRGVLSFDPTLKSFRWQLLPGPTDHKLSLHEQSQHPASPDQEESHVQEEVVLINLDDPPPQLPLPPGVSIDNSYRRLLNLGFPTSSFRGLNSSQSPEPWDSGLSALDPRRTASHRPMSGRGHTPAQLADRHMSAPVMDVLSQLRRDDPDSRSDMDNRPELSPSQEKAFIDDVKKTHKRKKSKLPIIRMRRELPPPAPHALCFCLKNKRSFSHEEIKKILENQLGTSVKTLMFDPLYVHLGVENTDGACLWVFTLADDAIKIHLLHQGLIFEEERVRVRLYDDVLYDEHEAYRLYRSVEVEHQRLQLMPSQRRSSQKSLGSVPRLQKHVAFTGSF